MRIPTDDNSATLHALFPTLVYQANLGDHAAYKAAFETNLSGHQFQPESGDGGKHFAGEYHGKILLHQEQSLRPFF